MKKALLFIGLVFLSSIIIHAQDTIPQTTQDTIALETPEAKPKKEKKEKKNKGQRIFYGGSLGLSFGNYTRIAVYPMIGYSITPKLSGGVELGYIYISDTRGTETYTSSNYGASIFARYRLIPKVYIHAEYATYSYELYYTDDREWVPFLFLGAGFVQKVGRSTYAFAQIKFDVLQDSNSPYGWDPLFRVGVSVGF